MSVLSVDSENFVNMFWPGNYTLTFGMAGIGTKIYTRMNELPL